MPSTTPRQQHTALMAMAVKSGKKSLEDLPAGARPAIRSMLEMSERQLEDYSHLKRRKSLLEK